ncbi:MAG: amino acid ABC transporter ATP-binding protein [Pseudomonadota bacterium]
MPHLVLDNVVASYGALKVLSGISLTVDTGEVVGLIGPSGSGKSTVLRVLTALLPPTSGTVSIDGAPIEFGSTRAVRQLREKVAIVFQHYNLFQNMSVIDNVTVAPVKIRGRPKREVTAEAEALLEKVGLSDKLNSYPDQLSGGQQQRVAIARALALKPEILLLDEVTAALDPELVSEVLDTITLLAGEGMTMLIVSHEMGFIRNVSSRVAFMADGAVVELGAPADVLDRPQEARTHEFVSKILRH